MQPHQERLALRIAEADVEFQDFWALVGHHQAGIQHAAEGAARALHGMDGRHQELFFDAVQIGVVTTGVGQYAPMPPVLGPVSLSNAAL